MVNRFGGSLVKWNGVNSSLGVEIGETGSGRRRSFLFIPEQLIPITYIFSESERMKEKKAALIIYLF